MALSSECSAPVELGAMDGAVAGDLPVTETEDRPRVLSVGQQRVMRLGWERHRSPAGQPVLTNRMSELFTYGSVGGVGRKPGPYPAPNRRPHFPLGRLQGFEHLVCAPPASPAAGWIQIS